LFLSSGIGGNVRETMTKMIDTARILRERHLYDGYLHLKILPGAPMDLIEYAGKYADRLSINMEAPSEDSLRNIAPNKAIKSGILRQMEHIEMLRRIGKISKRVGQVTQFVVGGTDDPGANDWSIITVADHLYRQLDFRRVYYSPFSPVLNTPLEFREAENPKRTARLYQADRLLKLYGFRPDELIFDSSGRLSLDYDPKEMWASAHPEIFPVEITIADPELLMRVPGLGPITVKRIIGARGEGRLKSVDDFLELGMVSRKSLKYMLINGKAGQTGPLKIPTCKADQLVIPFR